jgi:hypothetical protein
VLHTDNVDRRRRYLVNEEITAYEPFSRALYPAIFERMGCAGKQVSDSQEGLAYTRRGSLRIARYAGLNSGEVDSRLRRPINRQHLASASSV